MSDDRYPTARDPAPRQVLSLPSSDHAELARYKAADDGVRLVAVVYRAWFDWLFEDRAPDLDERVARRRTRRRLDFMAGVLCIEMDRRGLSMGQLERCLGWDEGRLGEVLARPSTLTLTEAHHLCLELDLSMADLFETETEGDVTS